MSAVILTPADSRIVLLRSAAGYRIVRPSGYVLPVAGASTLGGVKVGSGLAVAGDGTLSANTSISDNTDLGTLTNAVADALSLLATNAAGTKARRVALAAIHRAVLAAADAAGVRSAIGTDATGDTRPPATHTHPLSALTQSGATSGQVPAWSGFEWVPATVSGGGGGDMLSMLTAAEISVTGATTLTLNRMHVCSGTSADYTVTLPAASGNAGRFVGVRMASGLTRLVTVDGNGSETIDGALTRVMWSGESAILLCDGSNWFKVAGNSRPMICHLIQSGAQSLTSGAFRLLTGWTASSDTASLFDAANHRIVARRSGQAKITAAGSVNALNAASFWIASIFKGGTEWRRGATISPGTTVSQAITVSVLDPAVAAGNNYDLRIFPNTSTSTDTGAIAPLLTFEEVSTW